MEDSLFVLFVMLRSPRPWAPCCALGIIGKPLMGRVPLGGLVVFRPMAEG
jgi:hypothetical protein